MHFDHGCVLFDVVGTSVSGHIGKDKAVTEYRRITDFKHLRVSGGICDHRCEGTSRIFGAKNEIAVSVSDGKTAGLIGIGQIHGKLHTGYLPK